MQRIESVKNTAWWRSERMKETKLTQFLSSVCRVIPSVQSYITNRLASDELLSIPQEWRRNQHVSLCEFSEPYEFPMCLATPRNACK